METKVRCLEDSFCSKFVSEIGEFIDFYCLIFQIGYDGDEMGGAHMKRF